MSDFYKQTYLNGEVMYAGVYAQCKNNNDLAVIISNIYRKAKKTTIQNKTLWTKIDISDVPAGLRRKMLDHINK